MFLGYLEEDTKPTTSVQPSTVGKQVQTAMEKAGVDRRYRAHSLRSATNTKAVMPGASINQAKDLQTGAETQIRLKRFTTDLQEDASEVREF